MVKDADHRLSAPGTRLLDEKPNPGELGKDALNALRRRPPLPSRTIFAPGTLATHHAAPGRIPKPRRQTDALTRIFVLLGRCLIEHRLGRFISGISNTTRPRPVKAGIRPSDYVPALSQLRW
jgi:hypothetical protein